MLDDDVISLAAQIVSAHIANNDVASDQLPAFIRGVYQALATAREAAVEPIKPKSSVDGKKSVFADHILCLDCGGSFMMLKRHIRMDHQMTPDEYRDKWDLPRSYPMVAPDYAATRSKLAKASGFGRKVQAPPPSKARGRAKQG